MTKEWDFRCFVRTENGVRIKIRKWRMGRKETLADKPLDFENPICQQMGFLIGCTSQTLLTCINHTL